MAVTIDDFKAYIGDEGFENESLLNDCLDEAVALVDKYNKKYNREQKGYFTSEAPMSVVNRCYLIVAADLFERRNAPNGIANQQYATIDGIGQAPMRIARDPLAGVYPILRRWVGFM